MSQDRDKYGRFLIGHSPSRLSKRRSEALCISCKQAFRSFPSERKRYCSYKCYWLSRVGRQLSEEHRRKIGEKSKGRTHIVSAEARKKISKAGLGRKHSIETRLKMSALRQGEKSHLWKGGISKVYKKRYRTVEYKLWREAVFKRDNWTCTCGFSGKKGYITAHHIKSWAKFPELRFDVNNGVTLCEPCHSKTDNYKGRNLTKKLI